MIQTDAEGAVRVLTLARPEKRNALTPEGMERLQAAVTGADEPVVYLHGAGEAFCAGADLETVAAVDASSAVGFVRRGQRVARAIETADSVVVAGIDGAARGGGVELALACDLRVATPEATLAENGVKIGLFGAWGGTIRLPRTVSAADAFDLMLSGRTVDANEALRMGLVSRVAEDPRAVAEEVAEGDRRALATIKRRLRDDADRATRERREATAMAELIGGRDPE